MAFHREAALNGFTLGTDGTWVRWHRNVMPVDPAMQAAHDTALLAELLELCPAQFKVRDLIACAVLKDLIRRISGRDSQMLGVWLRRHKNKIVDGRRLVAVPHNPGVVASYMIEAV